MNVELGGRYSDRPSLAGYPSCSEVTNQPSSLMPSDSITVIESAGKACVVLLAPSNGETFPAVSVTPSEVVKARPFTCQDCHRGEITDASRGLRTESAAIRGLASWT